MTSSLIISKINYAILSLNKMFSLDSLFYFSSTFFPLFLFEAVNTYLLLNSRKFAAILLKMKFKKKHKIATKFADML